MAENTPNQIGISSGPPAPASSIGATYYGGGNSNVLIYYWVVARYASGATIPTGPAIVTGTVGAGNLSATRYVVVSWTAMPGATGYDVIRSNGPVYPVLLGPAACAVVLNTTATTYTDTGGALSVYPTPGLLAAQLATAEFTVDGVSSSIPAVKVQLSGAGGMLNRNLPVLDPATPIGSALQLGANNTLVPATTSLPTLGTANQVLGVNAADTALEYKTVSGTGPITVTNSPGGIAIGSSAATSFQTRSYASRPVASSGHGILTAIANGTYNIIDDGAQLWYQYGSLIVNPPPALTALINIGSPVIGTGRGSFQLQTANTSSYGATTPLTQSASAYTISVGVVYSMNSLTAGDIAAVGMLIHDATNNKQIEIILGWLGGTGLLQINRASAGVFSSNVYTATVYMINGGPVFFRVRVASGTRFYDISTDLYTWTTFYSESATAWISADSAFGPWQFGNGSTGYASGNYIHLSDGAWAPVFANS